MFTLVPLTSSQATPVTGAAALPRDPEASKYTAVKSATSEPMHGLVTSLGPDRMAIGDGQFVQLATGAVEAPANGLHSKNACGWDQQEGRLCYPSKEAAPVTP